MNTWETPDLLRAMKKTLLFVISVQALLGDRGTQRPVWQPGPDKYTRLDRQLQNANSQFIEEQQVQQQVQ